MSAKPSATLPGIVEKVFTSRLPGEPERAQIGVEGADHSQIRIENTLTSENGEDVHLKPGAKVKVTVRSTPAGNPGVKELPDFPTA
jgi:hypothetical protein